MKDLCNALMHPGYSSGLKGHTVSSSHAVMIILLMM